MDDDEIHAVQHVMGQRRGLEEWRFCNEPTKSSHIEGETGFSRTGDPLQKTAMSACVVSDPKHEHVSAGIRRYLEMGH